MSKEARLVRVQEILFYEWDPIGVNTYPQCRDEYDSYAPAILRMLEEGADEYRLTQHLKQLAHETIGQTALPDEHHRQIARRLRAPQES